MYVKICLRV